MIISISLISDMFIEIFFFINQTGFLVFNNIFERHFIMFFFFPSFQVRIKL